MFELIDHRYKLDCFALSDAREALDLTRGEFAHACGWSYQYQWRLEAGMYETISESTKNVIEDVLKGNAQC